MKKIFLLFLLLFSLNTFAQNKSKQIEFTYANQKITGTLKNSFRNLIYEIEVKVDNQDVQKFRIEKMNDITIDNEAYISSLNDIDTNLSANPNNFNNEANSNFKKEWILLKFLVKGDYNLYSYELPNFTQFYFSSPTSKQIEALVYKEYLINHRTTKANNQFQNQLYKDAPQPDLGFLEYKKIEYKKDKLIKYFNKLNNYDLEKGITKTKFNFSVFGGISINKFNVDKLEYSNNLETYQLIIGREGLQKIASQLKYTSPTIGFRVEIPFGYKGSSTVYSDLGVSLYKQNFFLDNDEHGKTNINHEKKSTVLHLNIGYKHYFKISNNVQLYAQGAASVINYFNSKNHTSWESLIGTGSDNGSKTVTNFGGTFGLGLKLNKHYFIEGNLRQSIEGENTIKTFTFGYTF